MMVMDVKTVFPELLLTEGKEIFKLFIKFTISWIATMVMAIVEYLCEAFVKLMHR